MPGGDAVSASQEIPEGMPQHASYWYRRWLVAQEGLDGEAAQRITERGNRDLMHADLGDLLEACGLGNFARPQSSHEVMQEAVAKVRTLATEATAAERDRIAGLAESVDAEYVDRVPCRCGAKSCRGTIIQAHASFADLIRPKP